MTTPGGAMERIASEELEQAADMGGKVLAASWENVLRRAAFTVRELEADAALGALVRRIREHPKAEGLAFRISAKSDPIHYHYKWQESALVEALERLDSLLPKEPEVVTGPSGWTYEAPKKDGDLYRQNRHNGSAYYFLRATEETVPPCDYGVVVKLMERANAQ